MEIQLSVVIWTIICFCVLMLILHNLLFKPVLAMFDRRREKIEAAKAKKTEQERTKAEQEKILKEQKELALKKQKEEKAEAIARIQYDTKKHMEIAKKEHLEKVEAYSNNIKKEYDRIIQYLSPEMNYVAEALAERIISHKID